MAKKKKKCPICDKNYRDYLAHIWADGHKTKTIAYLQKKRAAAKKKPRGKARGKTNSGFFKDLKRLIEKYE